MRLVVIAFIILWPEYTDHDEIFLILVLIRVPDAYIVQTGNATENDGIKKYLSEIKIVSPIRFRCQFCRTWTWVDFQQKYFMKNVSRATVGSIGEIRGKGVKQEAFS